MLLKVACFLFLVILGLVDVVISDKEKDCLYNKCEFRLLSKNRQAYTRHIPCDGTGNRQLVRSIDCNDGLTYHICCKFPFREDVQKSRQKWFRYVGKAGSKFSSECTKRILCEQACLDGLSGDARSDYPQLLNEDSEQTEQYVEAYNKGENQACYGQSAYDSRNFTSSDCVSDCAAKYTECQKELESSSLVEAYYLSSRFFHKLGMWSFSATWLIQDTIEEEIKKLKNIEQSVKLGAQKLYERMNKMRKEFQEWAKSENRERRAISKIQDESIYESKWTSFMPVYNKTDPNLVDAVNESLDYNQFVASLNTINEGLLTYNFKSGAFSSFLQGNYFRVFASILAVIFPFLIN